MRVCVCVCERERGIERERDREKTDLLRPINQSACEKSYGFNKFWLNQLEPAPFENPKLKVCFEWNGTFLRSLNIFSPFHWMSLRPCRGTVPWSCRRTSTSWTAPGSLESCPGRKFKHRSEPFQATYLQPPRFFLGSINGKSFFKSGELSTNCQAVNSRRCL